MAGYYASEGWFEEGDECTDGEGGQECWMCLVFLGGFSDARGRNCQRYEPGSSEHVSLGVGRSITFDALLVESSTSEIPP